MKVYPPRDIRPFVMYCVNGKPRSSLLIESTDSMIYSMYMYIPRRILGINNNYGAPCWTIFGDGMSARCWVVGAMFPPSIFEDRCVDLRRSMIDVSTFEDRCVDFRRSTIDVPTFEDRWRCVDLRTPMIDVKLCCNTCSEH